MATAVVPRYRSLNVSMVRAILPCPEFFELPSGVEGWLLSCTFAHSREEAIGGRASSFPVRKPHEVVPTAELVGINLFLEHVAQKCAAVLGERHASRQGVKARRANRKDRDTLDRFVGRALELAAVDLLEDVPGH